jgi:hypothetical protein
MSWAVKAQDETHHSKTSSPDMGAAIFAPTEVIVGPV